MTFLPVFLLTTVIPHIKAWYIILIGFIIKKLLSKSRRDKSYCNVLHLLDLTNIIDTLLCANNYRLKYNKITRLIMNLFYWAMSLNFILITIINPGLLNPGPKNNLSVLYHNVQGLIPFGELSDKNPSLNNTKLLEL